MEISLTELLQLIGGSPISKELARAETPPKQHPYHGRGVLAVLPHGFIHFGRLHDDDGYIILKDASNLRYWSKRDGGLPEFSASGPKDGDKIDRIGDVLIGTVIHFYLLGEWYE